VDWLSVAEFSPFSEVQTTRTVSPFQFVLGASYVAVSPAPTVPDHGVVAGDKSVPDAVTFSRSTSIV
jgi:hypothetical protein